jgi:hypothetical protein
METNFNEKESLRIINEMITQAQNNFRIGAADPSIFCGYFVASVAMLNFVLLYILENPLVSFHVWWLMIPMVSVSRWIGRINAKKAGVRTHIDKIVTAIWSAFPISSAFFLLVIFWGNYYFQTYHFNLLITPVILIFNGMAQFVTARALRMKSYLYASFLFWAGSLACIWVFAIDAGQFQFVILAICTVFGLAVPGHILNKKAKEHV